MVWDEAFDGVHVKDAVVVAWQSKERGRDAARAGHDVVMAPHDTSYFNIRQSTVPTEPGHEGLLPWTAVRTGSPLPSKGETAHILGGEGALWSEYATTPDELEAMVMRRMAALAESLWSGAENSEADFVARFGAQLPMLDASNVRYFVEPPPVRPRSVFIETTTVTIQPPTLFPQGPVTTTLRSPEVHETTAFDVALRLPGGRTSATMHAEVVKETPRLATPLPRTRSGAAYTYQEGVSHTLADAAKLPTIARGDVPQISSAAVEKALAGKMRKEHFAIHFDAFVRVPRDAVYRFAARGDDGVRVTVDGAKVLEDDGEHAPRDVDGEIALAAGAHPIRVDWFQGTEGKELSVWLELPDGTRAPLDLVVAR